MTWHLCGAEPWRKPCNRNVNNKGVRQLRITVHNKATDKYSFLRQNMKTSKFVIREVRDLFLFLMVSLLQTYLVCARCAPERFFRIAVFTLLMWVVLWKGNSLLSGYLSGKIPWIQFPMKRFMVGILVTVTFTVIAVLSLIALFEYFSIATLGGAATYTLYGSILITILISVFLHARQFLFFWRKASFEKEMFEKESIAARYESLKNQVSPHFLFNSLNTLTNLVYEDQDKAVKFIKQLAEVYRYVLDTREKEVVPIEDELRFLESYVFLQQIRFGNRLKVDLSVNDKNIKVAPLALQMLIENAIKHNIVSEAEPLTIRVYAENGFVVVENDLQRKASVHAETSSGVGLLNISRRYEVLSNEKVQVVETNKKFAVKLPVLKELQA